MATLSVLVSGFGVTRAMPTSDPVVRLLLLQARPPGCCCCLP